MKLITFWLPVIFVYEDINIRSGLSVRDTENFPTVINSYS